jgi:hypothetical protein
MGEGARMTVGPDVGGHRLLVLLHLASAANGNISERSCGRAPPPAGQPTPANHCQTAGRARDSRGHAGAADASHAGTLGGDEV